MAPIQRAPDSMNRRAEGLGVWEHRGKVAVAGVGHSAIDRRWDETAETSVGAYAIDALRKAMADAGVSPDQVDGLVVVPGTTTGDMWSPRPIPADFASKYLPTDNIDDGLTTLSVDWVLKNMPELTNVKFTMHSSSDCMSNAITNTAQAVGDGLTSVCLVVKGWANPAGRYGHGGANALETASGVNQWISPFGWVTQIPQFAFAFDQYCRRYNSNHDRMAPFIVNQRRNGRMFPEGYYYQHPDGELTVEDYIAGRWISKPMSLNDCDRPIQAAGAYLYTTAERARSMKQPPVYILGHASQRWKNRSSVQTLDEIEASTDAAARKTYEACGLNASQIDVFNPYDGYTLFTQYFLEAFQWHGVKRGEAHDFYAGDISVEGPHPFSSSGGNNGSGRTRYWMHTDCIQQLRGQAGARQVRIRAETAISGGPTPGGSDWTVWSTSPS